MLTNIPNKIQLIIAIRTARCMSFLSQDELGLKLKISKTTLARIERGDSSVSLKLFMSLINYFKSIGISINFNENNEVTISANSDCIKNGELYLNDETNNRSDKRRKKYKNLTY